MTHSIVRHNFDIDEDPWPSLRAHRRIFAPLSREPLCLARLATSLKRGALICIASDPVEAIKKAHGRGICLRLGRRGSDGLPE
jgi:hypothetical protein